MCMNEFAFMSVHRMHAVPKGDQKKESDPLGQELQKVVNCHGGAGNQTLIL